MSTPKNPVHLETREESLGGQNMGRQYSPTAARNRDPIGQAFLPLVPENATVLEIASGTGEHAVHMCGLRDDIVWQPSDPDVDARRSQSHWRTEREGQIAAPLALNMTGGDWWAHIGAFDVIFCANMIHIAPWEATLGLAEGAGHVLTAGGIFALYGPFKEGAATAPSNLAFDEALKRRNPAWGVRELQSVKHIFADAGLNMMAPIEMPKENRLIMFEKSH